MLVAFDDILTWSFLYFKYLYFEHVAQSKASSLSNFLLTNNV
uniref:Uncharacterized protein n=1 Tax=Triticum urartu TaxID=4572 RepID=A0A8R7K4G5_TRIUA